MYSITVAKLENTTTQNYINKLLLFKYLFKYLNINFTKLKGGYFGLISY